jgi:hypothetical protein
MVIAVKQLQGFTVESGVLGMAFEIGGGSPVLGP